MAGRRCSGNQVGGVTFPLQDAQGVAGFGGAGAEAGFPDAAYREVGAEIADDRSRLLGAADLVVVVRRPSTADIT